MGAHTSGNGASDEAARREYIHRLRAAVRDRREELVIGAVLRGHRDVETVCWRTGLQAAQVRRAVRDLMGRHRADSMEGAVRCETAARLREERE